MIRTYSFASGSDYVQLNWIHPKFLPEKYQLHYACRMETCSTNHEKNYSILASTQNLSSNTTFVRISNLRPSSNCSLFLLAVYNPASIDSGIVITGKTAEEQASK